MRTISLILVTACLASCGIPPSPQVHAHAGGGFVGMAPSGMMVGAQSSVINMESQKADAFWGGAK